MLFIFLACHNNENKLEIVKDHVFNADPTQFELSFGSSFCRSAKVFVFFSSPGKELATMKNTNFH